MTLSTSRRQETISENVSQATLSDPLDPAEVELNQSKPVTETRQNTRRRKSVGEVAESKETDNVTPSTTPRQMARKYYLNFGCCDGNEEVEEDKDPVNIPSAIGNNEEDECTSIEKVANGTQPEGGKSQNSNQIATIRNELDDVKDQYSTLRESVQIMRGDMRKELKKIDTIMTHMSSSSSAQPTGNLSPKAQVMTNKRRYEDMMEAQLVDIDKAFSDATIAPCIFNTVVSMIVQEENEGEFDAHSLQEIITSTMFSLKKSDKKEAYKARAGCSANSLRRKIMIRALKNAQLNTLGIFQWSSFESSNVIGTACKHPLWLTKICADGSNYITNSMVTKAQEIMETRNEFRYATYDHNSRIKMER